MVGKQHIGVIAAGEQAIERGAQNRGEVLVRGQEVRERDLARRERCPPPAA
jgi:hypothetical protein